MLHHPTHERLAELGLLGAAAAFSELIADPEAAELDHAAWLGLLLDREATRRMDRRLQTAALRPPRHLRPAPKTSTTGRRAGSDRT
jgi:hypothetical protein